MGKQFFFYLTWFIIFSFTFIPFSCLASTQLPVISVDSHEEALSLLGQQPNPIHFKEEDSGFSSKRNTFRWGEHSVHKAGSSFREYQLRQPYGRDRSLSYSAEGRFHRDMFSMERQHPLQNFLCTSRGIYVSLDQHMDSNAYSRDMVHSMMPQPGMAATLHPEYNCSQSSSGTSSVFLVTRPPEIWEESSAVFIAGEAIHPLASLSGLHLSLDLSPPSNNRQERNDRSSNGDDSMDPRFDVDKSIDLVNLNYDSENDQAKETNIPFFGNGSLSGATCNNCYFYIKAGFQFELDFEWSLKHVKAVLYGESALNVGYDISYERDISKEFTKQIIDHFFIGSIPVPISVITFDISLYLSGSIGLDVDASVRFGISDSFGYKAHAEIGAEYPDNEGNFGMVRNFRTPRLEYPSSPFSSNVLHAEGEAQVKPFIRASVDVDIGSVFKSQISTEPYGLLKVSLPSEYCSGSDILGWNTFWGVPGGFEIEPLDIPVWGEYDLNGYLPKTFDFDIVAQTNLDCSYCNSCSDGKEQDREPPLTNQKGIVSNIYGTGLDCGNFGCSTRVIITSNNGGEKTEKTSPKETSSPEWNDQFVFSAEGTFTVKVIYDYYYEETLGEETFDWIDCDGFVCDFGPVSLSAGYMYFTANKIDRALYGHRSQIDLQGSTIYFLMNNPPEDCYGVAIYFDDSVENFIVHGNDLHNQPKIDGNVIFEQYNDPRSPVLLPQDWFRPYQGVTGEIEGWNEITLEPYVYYVVQSFGSIKSISRRDSVLVVFDFSSVGQRYQHEVLILAEAEQGDADFYISSTSPSVRAISAGNREQFKFDIPYGDQSVTSLVYAYRSVSHLKMGVFFFSQIDFHHPHVITVEDGKTIVELDLPFGTDHILINGSNIFMNVIYTNQDSELPIEFDEAPIRLSPNHLGYDYHILGESIPSSLSRAHFYLEDNSTRNSFSPVFQAIPIKNLTSGALVAEQFINTKYRLLYLIDFVHEKDSVAQITIACNNAIFQAEFRNVDTLETLQDLQKTSEGFYGEFENEMESNQVFLDLKLIHPRIENDTDITAEVKMVESHSVKNLQHPVIPRKQMKSSSRVSYSLENPPDWKQGVFVNVSALKGDPDMMIFKGQQTWYSSLQGNDYLAVKQTSNNDENNLNSLNDKSNSRSINLDIVARGETSYTISFEPLTDPSGIFETDQKEITPQSLKENGLSLTFDLTNRQYRFANDLINLNESKFHLLQAIRSSESEWWSRQILPQIKDLEIDNMMDLSLQSIQINIPPLDSISVETEHYLIIDLGQFTFPETDFELKSNFTIVPDPSSSSSSSSLSSTSISISSSKSEPNSQDENDSIDSPSLNSSGNHSSPSNFLLFSLGFIISIWEILI